jgi:Transcriptional regulators
MAGKHVPDDVSVVGCDRLKVFNSVTPTLASLDTQTYEIGRTLMRALVRKIQNRKGEQARIVAKYVPGESVAPVHAEA